MIPQRTLRSELSGTELRERITECRKRLRRNRFTDKATLADEIPSEATLLDAEPAMRESMLSSQLISTSIADSGDQYELLLTAETQGIGIT